MLEKEDGQLFVLVEYPWRDEFTLVSGDADCCIKMGQYLWPLWILVTSGNGSQTI